MAFRMLSPMDISAGFPTCFAPNQRWMDVAPEGRDVSGRAYLNRLLVLNIVLQAFDGIATYQGLQMGFREANPLLLFCFAWLGVGPALLLFKTNACALLWLVKRTTPLRVGVPLLRGLAAVYCLLSLGPWLGKFISLAATLAIG
jgi:Domain of unknown function (DUF5658)